MDAFIEERLALGDRFTVVAFNGAAELLLAGSRDANQIQASLEAVQSRPSAISRVALEARLLRQDLAEGLDVSALQTRIERYVEGQRADVARSLAGLIATIRAVERPDSSISILYLSDGLPTWPGDDLAELASSQSIARIRVRNRVAPENDPTESGIPTPVVQYLVSRPRSRLAPVPRNEFEGSVELLESLIRTAIASGVAVYPVRPSAFHYPSIRDPRSVGERGRVDSIGLLRQLAERTGGALVPYGRFEASLTRLSGLLSSTYTLGFQIVQQTDPATRIIEIQLARKGLKAHYRRAHANDVRGPPSTTRQNPSQDQLPRPLPTAPRL